MTKVWKTGDLLDAAHMNDLAQISDVGTPGTPTGDALKAAIDAEGLAKGWGSGGGGASVTDNGDGTASTTSSSVTDNGDGTALAA